MTTRNEAVYKEIGDGVGTIVFICTWIYCMSTYGFLWGFGFGWVPAIILSFISRYTWPVFVMVFGFYWEPITTLVIGTGAAFLNHFL